VRAVEPLLADVRSEYRADPDLIRVVLNATSWVEASLAVEVLAKTVPPRMLVKLANIREAIRELPRCPMGMATDFESLARTWSLEPEHSAWTRSFEDSAGDYSVVLLGEGNYLYDIVIRTGDRALMWMPEHNEEDFLNPDVIDLIIERPTVLGNVISLVEAMGMPFYPYFYMSLEDWRHEYAQVVFEEVVQGFMPTRRHAEALADRADESPADLHGTEVRFRGVSDDGGLSWLL
jgi:hypothetical protein